MINRNREQTVLHPHRSDSQGENGALDIGRRRISLLEFQAIIVFVYCLACACCSISAYVWGSLSPQLADVAALVTPRPTRTIALTPTAASIAVSTETHTPTSMPTGGPTPTSTPHPTESPAQTPVPQSPLSTPTLPPTPTLAPLATPTPTSVNGSTPASIPTQTITPQATLTPTNTATPTQTPTPTPTSTPTPLASDLRIDHVEWNPPGPDLDSEYVLIENRGPGSQDMTNWMLSDDSNHTYTFPDGFVLAGMATVRVWTKSGRDTSIDLYWGRSSGVWGRDDTAFLLDDTGTVIDRHEW